MTAKRKPLHVASTTAAPMRDPTGEQALFEAYAASRSANCTPYLRTYHHPETEAMWQGWQAGRALAHTEKKRK